MTYVLPQTPAMAVEFQVRYTGDDSIGDARKVTRPGPGLADALEERDRIRSQQETYGLPEDAAIWWRIGECPWQPWESQDEHAKAVQS